jgi:hypothetical protein
MKPVPGWQDPWCRLAPVWKDCTLQTLVQALTESKFGIVPVFWRYFSIALPSLSGLDNFLRYNDCASAGGGGDDNHIEKQNEKHLTALRSKLNELINYPGYKYEQIVQLLEKTEKRTILYDEIKIIINKKWTYIY